MKVISVNTRQLPTLHNWRAACRRLGYAPVVLGQGRQWGGWIWRCQVLLDYLTQQLRDGHLAPGEWVVVQDSDDILPLRPAASFAREVLSRHQGTGAEVLFGVEHLNPCTNIGWIGTPLRSINFGCTLGQVARLCHMYRWMIGYGPSTNDDQVLAGLYYQAHPTHCALDTDHTMVHNLSPLLTLHGGGWCRWPKTAHFVHFTGNRTLPTSRLQFTLLYNTLARELNGEQEEFVPVPGTLPPQWTKLLLLPSLP